MLLCCLLFSFLLASYPISGLDKVKLSREERDWVLYMFRSDSDDRTVQSHRRSQF